MFEAHPIPQLVPPVEVGEKPEEEKKKPLDLFLAREGPQTQAPATFCKEVGELSSFCTLFKNSEAMLFLVEVVGIASKISAFSGREGESALPYLALPAFPLFFYHGVLGAHGKLKMGITALRVDKISEALLYFAQGLDALGGALATVTKSFMGIAVLAGITQYALVGLIFTTVLPRVLLATTFIGGVAQIWSFMRVNSAIKQFQMKKEDFLDNKSSQALKETLDFLYGPLERFDKKVALEKDLLVQQVEMEQHTTKCFRNKAHLVEFRDKVDDFYAEFSKKVEQVVKKEEDSKVLGETGALFESLLDLKRGEELAVIEKALALYETLEKEGGGSEELTAKKRALEELKADFLSQGCELLESGESNLRRNLYSHALLLLMMALSLVGTKMLLIQADKNLAATILLLSASLLTTGTLLFDNFISPQGFQTFEKKTQLLLSA